MATNHLGPTININVDSLGKARRAQNVSARVERVSQDGDGSFGSITRVVLAAGGEHSPCLQEIAIRAMKSKCTLFVGESLYSGGMESLAALAEMEGERNYLRNKLDQQMLLTASTKGLFASRHRDVSLLSRVVAHFGGDPEQYKRHTLDFQRESRELIHAIVMELGKGATP